MDTLKEVDSIVDKIRNHPKLIVADDFEVVVETVRTKSIRFRDRVAGELGEDDSVWLGLRVLHRKAPGVAATTRAHPDAIDDLVKSAFKSAESSTGDPWFRFPIWRDLSLAPGSSALELPGGSWLSGFEGDVAFTDERYELREHRIVLRRKTEKIRLSAGHRFLSARWTLATQGKAGLVYLRDEWGTHGDASEGVGALHSLAREAITFAEAIPWRGSGRQNVIFGPAVMSQILAGLMPWFSAQNLRLQRSPLAQQDPARLFSPVLHLVEGETHGASPHPWPFDHEGSPRKARALVERGELKSLLYDTYEAMRENRLSTGSLLRPYGARWPEIRAASAHIVPGKGTVESLLRECGEGIFLHRVEFQETRADAPTQLQLKAYGQCVKNGQWGPSVAGISLNIDVFDLMRRAVAVGSDLRFHGVHGSPSILFENVPLEEERGHV